jgi:Spo0E like sporulation regulatory protein
MKIPYEEITYKIIEEKRQEMIRLALDYGYSSHIAVQASQELDSLLNAVTLKY